MVFKKLIGWSLFIITVVSLLTFLFGPFIFSKILPDYNEIVSNFMCGVGGMLASPIVIADILHIIVFSIILSVILTLFVWEIMKKGVLKVVSFIIFFIIFSVIGLVFIKGRPIPWFSGDDIGFATAMTIFLTLFAIVPFVKKKPALVAIILVIFVLFWGIYKFGGIFISKEAENRGAEKCLEEFPINVPQVNEDGKIKRVKIPYDIFKPTFVIGAFLGLISLVVFIITFLKVKG